MTRSVLFVLIFMIASFRLPAQAQSAKLYDPSLDAAKDLTVLAEKAKKEKKQIFVIAGGNWCGWCMEFEKFVHGDKEIDSILKADYIVYHLNFSKENYNQNVFTRLEFPQRFGFPVMIILDQGGKKLHTQNSEYLEQGKSYNRRKVKEFLLSWNRAALDPGSYQSQ